MSTMNQTMSAMTQTKGRYMAIAVASFLALGLAACSTEGDDPEVTTPAETVDSVAETTAEETKQPQPTRAPNSTSETFSDDAEPVDNSDATPDDLGVDYDRFKELEEMWDDCMGDDTYFTNEDQFEVCNELVPSE